LNVSPTVFEILTFKARKWLLFSHPVSHPSDSFGFLFVFRWRKTEDGSTYDIPAEVYDSTYECTSPYSTAYTGGDVYDDIDDEQDKTYTELQSVKPENTDTPSVAPALPPPRPHEYLQLVDM